MTPAQQRLLERVRATGELRQNGRARPQVEALHAAGLIEYDFELRGVGSGFGITELYTIWPAGKVPAGKSPCKAGRQEAIR